MSNEVVVPAGCRMLTGETALSASEQTGDLLKALAPEHPLSWWRRQQESAIVQSQAKALRLALGMMSAEVLACAALLALAPGWSGQ